MELEIRKAPISTCHDFRETLRISNCTGAGYNMNTADIGVGGK